jgi:D-serine deaminase-like pyridoxal phosphate-dependent protein
MPGDWAAMTWEQYRDALQGVRLPAALVNLNAFELNVDHMADMVRRSGKTLRVASKSLRCPYLLKLVFDRAPEVMRGIMSFTCEEAEFLAGLGFDDFLVAYPTVQPSDMDCLVRMTKKGATVAVVADCRRHLDALSQAGRSAGLTLRACIDVDASYRPARGRIHVGVRRSPVRDEKMVRELVRYARRIGGVRIAGVMAYEAQIASLPDASPFSPAMNPLRSLIRALSKPDTAALRRRVARVMAEEGVRLDFFNGGGTGSLDWTPQDSSVTEVTAGSGFLCSHLFSYFRHVKLNPAAFFALQAIRVSDPGYVTCLGGGYVASGEAGADKLPVPYLPDGLSLIGVEGAGEVQTPLLLGKKTPPIHLGDPVLFRHAKAGELAERFNEYVLLRDGRVIGREPTYRGLGRCFL